MASIFEKLWRLGPAAFVAKAIIVAILADGLLLAFILFRRASRKRYFAKRDTRVFELRQKWDALISGEIPYETWRKIPFDRRIVESIALDAFEAAGPEESARLLKFLRTSGLIEKRIFEARRLTGWRRMRALVALGRTRAPGGIPALAEGLRDSVLELRLAPNAGTRGTGASPGAGRYSRTGRRITRSRSRNPAGGAARIKPHGLPASRRGDLGMGRRNRIVGAGAASPERTDTVLRGTSAVASSLRPARGRLFARSPWPSTR